VPVPPELYSASTLSIAAMLLVAVAVVLLVRRLRAQRSFATPLERAVHDTLHIASLAAPALRRGLSAESAAEAAPHLRALLGTAATALTDEAGALLAWSGSGEVHTEHFLAAARRAASTGRRELLVHAEIDCGQLDCEVRALVVVPLVLEHNGVVGVLGALSSADAGPGLVGTAGEVARYACTQIELAELDNSRARVASAEVRALRAQISPHFIYNALTTVASFIRTDPERARELVLEFADFTRYSFRTAGEFTTLADELRNIDRYLTLERARFGPRLQVRLQVAPEVLGVVLPFLALQPLVENAVRHGLSASEAGGTVSIVAEDAGAECLISVEDDGAGMDPDRLRDLDEEQAHFSGAHVGLGNVDDRLRAAFGDDYGLVVETALGAGTKVSMRVPKFRPGVRT
jgi:two-component system, LytTR family, sensor kinase